MCCSHHCCQFTLCWHQHFPGNFEFKVSKNQVTDLRCQNTAQPGAEALTTNNRGSLYQPIRLMFHWNLIQIQMSFGAIFSFTVNVPLSPWNWKTLDGVGNHHFHVSQHIFCRTVVSVWQSHSWGKFNHIFCSEWLYRILINMDQTVPKHSHIWCSNWVGWNKQEQEMYSPVACSHIPEATFR